MSHDNGFEASNYTDNPLFNEVDIEDDDDIETALAIYYMYKKAGWGVKLNGLNIVMGFQLNNT